MIVTARLFTVYEAVGGAPWSGSRAKPGSLRNVLCFSLGVSEANRDE